MFRFLFRVSLPVLAIGLGVVGYWHVVENTKSAQAVEPPTIPARVPFQRTIAWRAWSKHAVRML